MALLRGNPARLADDAASMQLHDVAGRGAFVLSIVISNILSVFVSLFFFNFLSIRFNSTPC